MTRLKKYICIILTAAIMLCLAGCSRDVTDADTYFMEKEDIITDVLASVGDTSVFCDTTAFKELVRVSKTDMTALCLSEESLAPSVYDSGANKLWRSLPEEYAGENAGVICLTLLIGGNEYVLNSQSDCMARDGITYETDEDSVKINYAFNKTLSDGTVIDITVPVLYKGADGTVSVSVDCSAIDTGSTSDGVVLGSLSLLPWLGAFEGLSEGDFLLIPDGSGAIIDAGVPSETVRSYEVSLYGGDGASAIMPAFGMKSGDGAFVAVIDEGDALAKIRAHKASSEEGSNRVYAEFTLTPTESTDGGCYVSSVGYKGNIRLSYRFISKENADYTAMATVARELMIRNGSLLTGNKRLNGAYPFALSLIGVDGSKAYTDYAQCYDVLTTLNSRGINTISLRYRGVFTGGIQQESGTALNERLGSDARLSELEGLVATQDISVYAETNLFAFSDTPEDVSLDIRGERQTELTGLVPYAVSIYSVASARDRVSSMLYEHRESFFGGLCINDAGTFLPADYSKGEVLLPTDAARELSAQISGISATKSVAVNKGNLYAVKYADMIFELPDRSFYTDADCCVQIPFVQIVLHGICDYSLSAINLADDSTEAFLKAVEYGAVPYYEWYCRSTDNADGDRYYYMNSVSSARQQYESAAAALGDLRGSRITDHGMAAENVYFTVYDNETEIYVNYSDEAVTVSGVTVEANSFIRVN